MDSSMLGRLAQSSKSLIFTGLFVMKILKKKWHFLCFLKMTWICFSCNVIRRCSGVTDRGIEAIGQGCPALEMINIAYNSKITDSSLISLSKCSNLKALEIRGCPCVSSVGLSAIAMECRQLAVLDIKKCFNINDNAMHPLGKFSQNLEQVYSSPFATQLSRKSELAILKLRRGVHLVVLQINLSYCSVTDVGLLSVARINRLRSMTILHLSGLTPNGLAAALLTCGGLTKVKLHSSFKPLLPQNIFKHMEACGCMFHWRNKAFQVLYLSLDLILCRVNRQ